MIKTSLGGDSLVSLRRHSAGTNPVRQQLKTLRVSPRAFFIGKSYEVKAYRSSIFWVSKVGSVQLIIPDRYDVHGARLSDLKC